MSTAAYFKAYRQRNLPKLMAQARVRFQKNKVAIYKRVRLWRKRNLKRQREYHRNYYAANAGRRKAQMKTYPRTWRYNPVKDIPRAKFKKAVADGLIKRPSRCSKCRISCKPDGHHEDYSKPLKVKWLCKPCHAFLHRKPLPRVAKARKSM